RRAAVPGRASRRRGQRTRPDLPQPVPFGSWTRSRAQRSPGPHIAYTLVARIVICSTARARRPLALPKGLPPLLAAPPASTLRERSERLLCTSRTARLARQFGGPSRSFRTEWRVGLAAVIDLASVLAA